MTATLNPEVLRALETQPGRALQIDDPTTLRSFIVMARDDFARLVYDDSDLTEAEMIAASRVAAAVDVEDDPLSP
jgi:hypothetical protein